MMSNDLPSGEQRLMVRQRRIYAIKGGLFVVGLLTGMITGYVAGDQGFGEDARWPTELAVALAVTYVTTIVTGAYLLWGLTDELERGLQNKSFVLAGLVYIIAYPIWFTLWKGGLLPEPSHTLLFLAFYLSMACSYLFYRFR
jgi:hypothetical protein